MKFQLSYLMGVEFNTHKNERKIMIDFAVIPFGVSFGKKANEHRTIISNFRSHGVKLCNDSR